MKTPDNSSDSDDWTLITPPHSSSSSPDRAEPLNLRLDRFVSQESRARVEDDVGLTEIDLNATGPGPAAERDVNHICHSGQSDSPEPAIQPGFQPLCNTSEEELEDEESASQDSRRSSLTQSELGEYVDLSKRDLKENSETVLVQTSIVEGDVTLSKDEDTTIEQGQTTVARQPSSDSEKRENAGYLTSIKTMFDDLNETVQASNRRAPLRFIKLIERNVDSADFRHTSSRILSILILSTLTIVAFITINYRIYLTSKQSNIYTPNVLNGNLELKFDSSNSIPTSHQYVELKLLHGELSQCIKRQSPTSFKYYMSDDRFKGSDSSSMKPHPSGNGMNQKPYRGLVCYGQEMQWRERFDRLKSEYNLDLRRLMQEAKKKVTNEMLEFHHPSLKFKLILNQIEYLDFLENKRNKKQSEETIKYLKAENLQLLRRLNQPNDTGYQKVFVSLELQNAKLQRENEALKANLIGKAGPTYIRQSLELEQYERENVMLKQFHHQVAQEVSKSLKQFNLHIIDASTILDDHESLKTQLMLTRGYLRRLSEKISTLLIENESLKEELKETYQFGPINEANLPATHNANYDGDSTNDLNVLVADSCARNLSEEKERNKKLAEELDRMKRNCQLNAELEKSSGRHLNRTGGNRKTMFEDDVSGQAWKQLGSAETGMDKHSRDRMILQEGSSIVDELAVFLTKFDHQIEAWSNKNALAIVERENGLSSSEADFLLETKQVRDSAKIIPNYVREVVRALKEDKSHLWTGSDHFNEPSLTPRPPAPMRATPASLFNQTKPIEQQIVEKPVHKAETTTETVDEVVSRQNASSSEETIETVEHDHYHHGDPLSLGVSPGWLFKRAKQRKQLRRQQEEPKSNWMMMRATLRETLRKAASYIDKHYIDGVRETVNSRWRCKSSASQKDDSKQRCGAKSSGKQEKKSTNSKKNRYENQYNHQDEL